MACLIKTSITKKRLKNGSLDEDLLKTIKLKHKLYKGMIKTLIPKITYNNYNLSWEVTSKHEMKQYFHIKFKSISNDSGKPGDLLWR